MSPVFRRLLLFLLLLCVTVTEAAQVVGTVLVLSLVITPAAAAQRLSARASVVLALSTLFARLAADGGLVVNIVYVPDVRASSFITFIAFAIYAVARLCSALRRRSRRTPSSRPDGDSPHT